MKTAAFLLSVLTATVGLTDSARGQPEEWHYLVIEVDQLGLPEPVFHRRVELQAPRPSLSEIEAAAAREDLSHRRGSVDVEVLVGVEIVFRDVVAIERFVHAEAPGRDGALSRVEVELPKAAAAVRVPAVAGGTLVLRAAASASFDLDRIERTAEGFRLAGTPASGAGAVLGSAGDPGNRVDVLIMGDGYTAAQATTFNSDAASLQSSFFSITPYSEYSNFVNFSTLFAASRESGADHPPYNAGCSGDNKSCCSDSAALSDPLAGTYKTTAFDGRFCTNMIHRLLVVDSSKVLAAAAAVPDWDRIFVLVNDTTYGGSGGYLSVASTNVNAPGVIVHEYGHSFTRLADEYESAYPGFPVCSDVTSPPCEANVTDETTRTAVKWEPWISPSTPVPTPEDSGYSGSLGLFEGARYLAAGMYRPRESQCLMRSLGMPFCAVCAQAYVKTLYDGGWGVPASGIDGIEPGSESPPIGTVPVSGSQTFSIGVLSPAGGPQAAIEWRVDGILQVGETVASFEFTPPGYEMYTVEVTVRDTTALVNSTMAGTSLTSSRLWTVDSTGTAAIFKDGFESPPPANWSDISPRSCAGHCGASATTCFCDSQCKAFGDCCIDACLTCGYCPP